MKIKPNQIIALSFISASFIGALLLCVPAAVATGQRIGFIDALFTTTSAVCVTGLVVKDTGSFFTAFGQMIILGLIQLGGLGIMTFSTAFAILLGKRLTIRETVIMQNALDYNKADTFKTIIKHIILVTLCIELAGAILLYARWQFGGRPEGIMQGWSNAHIIYSSIFHAVSAFCNAGFSLYANNLAGFKTDVAVNLIMTGLIILGGLGFVVLLDLPHFKFWRKDRIKYLSKIGLQTKIVLLVSLILILVGAAFILLFEWDNTLSGMPLKDKILCSYFHSVTPRTAGFNTLPVDKFISPTLFITTALMFIGASPGSTGGGIKTVTLAVLLAAAVAMVKNRNRITMFTRTIPRPIFRRAFIIALMAVAWVFIATIALCIIERPNYCAMDFALKNLFEVVSAFGTVGLSAGLTAALAPLSKIILIITMWMGRVGPLTLALAIAAAEEQPQYIYPEEKIMVG